MRHKMLTQCTSHEGMLSQHFVTHVVPPLAGHHSPSERWVHGCGLDWFGRTPFGTVLQKSGCGLDRFGRTSQSFG